MERPFKDRTEAGRFLAEKLKGYAKREDVLVLALPRGGVPIGFEIARALNAPLDVYIVRKLGVPWQPELAMGAIATGRVLVLNDDVVRHLHISDELINRVTAQEEKELERREHLYRGDGPAPEVRGRTVILVDDGVATGTTMRVALAALRKQAPARLVVAVPVAPRSTCEELSREADEAICGMTPGHFVSVSQWYESFPQTTDEEVQHLLKRATSELAVPAPS
jgi:putative phosphoribosyl transferase